MTSAHPRRILWLLAAATLIPIAILSWLGMGVLRQDQDAERQRRREALELNARRLALDIERRLQDVEAGLARGEGVAFSATGPVSSSSVLLLYQSALLPLDDVSSPALVNARALEFQQNDQAAATTAYRNLTGARDPRIRAAALVGLASVLNKRGDLPGALGAYSELDALGETTVAGQPASLVARHARCRALERTGDAQRLRTEADELARVLNAGGWRIDLDLGRGELRRAGKVVTTTPLELKLMGVFASRVGRVLSRRTLIDEAWGHDTAITERVVDNQIAHLRQEIEPSPSAPRFLKSVRGLGYRFD
jgi:hypothetical protein